MRKKRLRPKKKKLLSSGWENEKDIANVIKLYRGDWLSTSRNWAKGYFFEKSWWDTDFL